MMWARRDKNNKMLVSKNVRVFVHHGACRMPVDPVMTGTFAYAARCG
jgi:hypothetical protein